MSEDTNLADMLAAGVLDGGSTEQTDATTLPVVYDSNGLGMIAFGIWAYEAGRDIGKVQSLLHDRTGMLVPLHQLRAWRESGNWSGVAVQVHQTLEGPVLATTHAMLTRATMKAMSAIIGILDSNSVSESTRLRAAMTVLDRGGFPVLLRGEQVADSLAANSAYANVSDEELEADYREFNADTYTDKYERIAEDVTVQSYRATTAASSSRNSSAIRR